MFVPSLRSFATRASLAILSALTLLGSATSVEAQCFTPDDLNGGCWDPAFATLPPLGPIVLPGSGLCWDDCNAVSQEELRVIIAPPVEVSCGHFETSIEVYDVAQNAVVMVGQGSLDYTRTWEEFNPVTALGKKVWRFVAKFDLFESGAGLPTCYSPSCMPVHTGSFHYGYVDYAQDCTTGVMENAVVLYHPCDFFSHFPGVSDRPGTFHPNSYSAIVAPDTSSNPFVPTPSLPPSGAVVNEAMRNVNDPLVAGACQTEDPISGGVLNLLGTACLCPVPLPSLAQSASLFGGQGTCLDGTGLPSSFQSLNFYTFGLPFAELLRTSLGTWTTSNSYPGEEAVWAAEGLFLHRNAGNTDLALPADTLDMFYGASTDGGDLVFTDGPNGVPLGQEFTDLASNSSQFLFAVSLPVVTGVKPTTHLIYVNTN